MASPEITSYEQHYARLRGIAQTMQTQKDMGVEALLQHVRDAQESYAFCDQRIRNATEELTRLLGQGESQGAD